MTLAFDLSPETRLNTHVSLIACCGLNDAAAAVAMHSTTRRGGGAAAAAGAGGVGGGPRALSAAAVACVTGSTSSDSLSVALGSTFGAFLAVGFIVALVFLSKWQHSRRLAKQFAGLPLDDVHFQTSAATLPHDHSFGTLRRALKSQIFRYTLNFGLKL